jgi:hypothetical protein
MVRVRKFLGKWWIRLAGVGVIIVGVGACAGGMNADGWRLAAIAAVSGVLVVAGICLAVLGSVARYLWLAIWLVTAPVRFIAWLAKGGGVAFAKRLAGFLLVTLVVIPGVIILELFIGEYLGPFAKMSWR